MRLAALEVLETPGAAMDEAFLIHAYQATPDVAAPAGEIRSMTK